MASITSPNMNLVVPSVGSEQGPQYAFDINVSLSLIDAHDHSSGKGVQITPAGMNINATLNFNDNLATNLAGLTLENQPSANTSLGTISAAPGSGSGIGDLYYTDYAGNTIQLTKSGQVNVVAASIPGESYNSGTFTWTQTQSGLPTTPANFDIGSITLRPNVAATTFGTTLVPPSTSNITIGLPIPQTEGYTGVPNFVTMDQSGQQADTYHLDNITLNASGTAIQVKPGGITTTQISSTANITGSQLSPTANILASQLAPGALGFNSQIFTTSGTFTVPAGVNELIILGAGAGGGGGSGGVVAVDDAPSAGAGGQGSVPALTHLDVTPGVVYTVTVGTGGAGGAAVTGVANSGNAGTAGTSTIISIAGPSFTGNRTSGSPIITSVSSETGLAVGMVVSGTDIPSNAYIKSIDTGTQITLSISATSGASTSTSFTSYTPALLFNGATGGLGGSFNSSAPTASPGDTFSASGSLSGGGTGGGGNGNSVAAVRGGVGNNTNYALGGSSGIPAATSAVSSNGGGGGGGGASVADGGNGGHGSTDNNPGGAGSAGSQGSGGGGGGGAGGNSNIVNTSGAGGAGGNGYVEILWLG